MFHYNNYLGNWYKCRFWASYLQFWRSRSRVRFGNMGRRLWIGKFTKERCTPSRNIRRKGTNGALRIWVIHIPRINPSLMACPALCPGPGSPYFPTSTKLQPYALYVSLKFTSISLPLHSPSPGCPNSSSGHLITDCTFDRWESTYSNKDTV